METLLQKKQMESVEEQTTLGSLFDGIGGFPYAASFYGIRTLWASEVEPGCVSVTKRHFPGMAHVGDITRLHGGKIAPVDIITFGSPCQGLSLAGRRRGLADERSGLFLEAVRVLREMREATDGRYPKFALWENVPGVLSSAGGRDFRAVLEAFTEAEVPMPGSGRWGDAGMVRGGRADIAWVVYNAQHFGTAQRRRRVFLVADFTARRSGEVLFIPKSLRQYFEAGGTPRQGLAAFAGSSAENAGRGDCGYSGRLTGEGRIRTYCIAGNTIDRKEDNGGNGTGIREDLSYTLTAMDCHAVNVPVTDNDQYRFGQGAMRDGQGGSCPTLNCGCEQPYITWPSGKECGRKYTVRRFTPLECERLQGFPDGWTAEGYDGKPVSDTKRYQMLGNSIAVPCVAYIMQGICQAMGHDGEPSRPPMSGYPPERRHMEDRIGN